jgi:putative FmdB family regulatory protein
MPHYEFFCHNCKKLFARILSLVDYEEGEVLCPHCGSKNIEQCWSASTLLRRRRAPDNRICGRCTNFGQLTLPTNRRRLVAFQQDSLAARKLRDVPFTVFTNRKERFRCLPELLK